MTRQACPPACRSRCTSPASSRTSPPSVRTTRRPSPSMPAPVPVPPPQRTSWPSSASRTRTASRIALVAGAHPGLERAQQRRERRLDRARLEPQRAGATAQLGREVLRAQRDVESDADDRPALLHATFDEDARDLAPVEEHVVGPFDRRVRPDHLRHRRPRRQRQQSRRLADHDRAQQRAPRRRAPCAALAPAARRLLGRRHDRAVRSAAGGELPGAGVGRVGQAEMRPRTAEWSFKSIHGSSSAATGAPSSRSQSGARPGGRAHGSRILSSSSTARSSLAAASPWLTATESRRYASS